MHYQVNLQDNGTIAQQDSLLTNKKKIIYTRFHQNHDDHEVTKLQQPD